MKTKIPVLRFNLGQKFWIVRKDTKVSQTQCNTCGCSCRYTALESTWIPCKDLIRSIIIELNEYIENEITYIASNGKYYESHEKILPEMFATYRQAKEYADQLNKNK
jgi:hypothetical protein